MKRAIVGVHPREVGLHERLGGRVFVVQLVLQLGQRGFDDVDRLRLPEGFVAARPRIAVVVPAGAAERARRNQSKDTNAFYHVLTSERRRTAPSGPRLKE
jgi:hypothetical protein